MRAGASLFAAAGLALALAAGPAAAFYHDMGAGEEPAAAAGTVVEVVLDEWRIDLSPARVAAGRVTFRIRNAGSYPHALALERREGGVELRGDILRGGGREERTVELPAGTYELVAYCPLPGHREQGMVATLEVGA